jgi:murein DD-endopeptidase MepM/ murein hydrolase activator NlpD
METNPMKKKVILLLSVVTLNGWASIKPKSNDDLARTRSQVMELGAKLSTLEKEIGSKNNLYLSSISQIKQFEGDVKLYRDHLNQIQADVKTAQAENKSIIQSYLVESENEATEEWQRRVHLELLKQAQTKLKNKELELVSFQSKISDFDQKIAGLKQNEEELSSVIKELEIRKKTAMEIYMAKVQSKKKFENAVQTQKLETRIAKVKQELSQAPIIMTKPDRFFASPVDDFLTFTPSAKGVTFKYQSVQPIKAVGGGKVVFAGDLASYGQVVLIDHGNDLRTVLLGKMNIKVKKNDSVQNGDILAYTQNDSKEPQNLYFEVRKKNTAQNTILWLDPNGVSKI